MGVEKGQRFVQRGQQLVRGGSGGGPEPAPGGVACGENICFTRSMKEPAARAGGAAAGGCLRGAGACATAARTMSAKRRTRA